MFNQINLELKPDVWLGALISVPIVASILLLTSLAIPPSFCALVIGLNLWICYAKLTQLCLLKRSNSIVRVRVSPRSVSIYDTTGLETAVRVKDSSFVSRWFCIIKLEALLIPAPDSKKFSIARIFKRKQSWSLILCDSNVSNVDQLRRLRVASNYGNLFQSRSFVNA